jgi:hypothetical protein
MMMDRITDELIDRFCAHGVAVAELRRLSVDTLAEQISELRDDEEPAWIAEMDDEYIAQRIMDNTAIWIAEDEIRDGDYFDSLLACATEDDVRRLVRENFAEEGADMGGTRCYYDSDITECALRIWREEH